jgi:hypothetical protein
VSDHDDRREAYLPPLPLGRLRPETLVNVALGRAVQLRSGPWVPLGEDDSRLIRVLTAAERPATGRSPLPRVAPGPWTARTDLAPVGAAARARAPTVRPGSLVVVPSASPVDDDPAPSTPAAAEAPPAATSAGTAAPEAPPAATPASGVVGRGHRESRAAAPRPRRDGRRAARGRDPLLGRLTDAIQRSAAASHVAAPGAADPPPGGPAPRETHVRPGPGGRSEQAPAPGDDDRWEDLFAPRRSASG